MVLSHLQNQASVVRNPGIEFPSLSLRLAVQPSGRLMSPMVPRQNHLIDQPTWLAGRSPQVYISVYQQYEVTGCSMLTPAVVIAPVPVLYLPCSSLAPVSPHSPHPCSLAWSLTLALSPGSGDWLCLWLLVPVTDVWLWLWSMALMLTSRLGSSSHHLVRLPMSQFWQVLSVLQI